MNDTSEAYKPEGYSSISPYIMASNAEKFIAFATEVFAAKPLRRMDNSDGSVMHAELQIDDSVLMIADGGDTAFPVWLHVYVSDVDATYQQALAAQGECIAEPSESDEIDRRAGVKDPTGNTWWISTPISR
jgi:PhnB protein